VNPSSSHYSCIRVQQRDARARVEVLKLVVNATQWRRCPRVALAAAPETT
jgi:hypothetical protein